MFDSEEAELSWAKAELASLLGRMRSCLLATVSPAGEPLQSYAPVFVDDKRRFYVFVSAMALHYAHLRRTGKASVSFVEDEAAADNLFARKRVTLACRVCLVERECEEWIRGIDALEARHGETMAYLKELQDFDLFRLEPGEGRLALGFGKAYRVSGDALETVSYLGSGGHRAKS